jgi:cytochrome c oxidase subunit IV
MTDTVEAVQKHVRSYILIGVALIFMTMITVGIAYVDLGHPTLNMIVALTVATIKAGLVAAVFMHLFWDLFAKMAVLFKVLAFTGLFFTGLFSLTLWSYRDEVKSPAKHNPVGIRTLEEVQKSHVP